MISRLGISVLHSRVDGAHDILRNPHGLKRARPSQIQSFNTVKAGNRTTGRRAGLRELNWNSFYNTLAHRDRRFSSSSGIPANQTGSDAVNDRHPANALSAYDDQGRRLHKTAGAASAHYLYNGSDIVAEYDSTWVTPTARYTHGLGVDDPLIRVTATAAQYYHSDGLGSIVAVSNPSGGTDATARYDARGNTLGGSGTIPSYGYTGREPDDTGLLYYRARCFKPSCSAASPNTRRFPLASA
jgi:hypothetical protein